MTTTINQVFLCPICKNIFNTNSKLPLSLPCGHVICSKCLILSQCHSEQTIQNTVKCLLDKQIFNINISSLKPNQAILANLPYMEQKSHKEKEFVCKYHPHKKIKYICEYDNEVFCSICLCEHHNNSPHVVRNFIPQKEHFLNEIQYIKGRIQEKKTELNSSNKFFNETRLHLCNKIKEEIVKLNDDIDFIIQQIEKQKTLFEENIKNILKIHLDEINESKMSINQQLITLNEIDSLVNEYNNKLLMNGLIYGDIMSNKNEIFSKWESFLKTNNVNDNKNNKHKLNNITFPKLNIRHIDLLNIFNFKVDAPKDSVDLESEFKYHNINNNYFNLNTTRHNNNKQRINFRKGSDPTQNTKQRNSVFDNKPIALNNQYHVYQRNTNSNSVTTRTKTNSRKSVSSSKYKNHNVLIIN